MVVGYTYNNSDAYDAYKFLDLIGLSMEALMSQIVNAATNQGYMKEDHEVSMDFSSNNGKLLSMQGNWNQTEQKIGNSNQKHMDVNNSEKRLS